MSNPRASAAERMLAALFVVPLGLSAKLIDELPSTIAAAKERFARIRGVAPQRDVPFAAHSGSPRGSAGGASSASPPGPGPGSPPESLSKAQAGLDATIGDAHIGTATARASDLALPDYDQLPAAHIVGKLASLTRRERDAIEAHELAHRHRRTVLGKLAQLSEAGQR